MTGDDVHHGNDVRWDLGEGQEGFLSGESLPPRHLWFRIADQVSTIIADRLLSYATDHEARDILLAAARALKPGGRFRIIETDGYHPSDAYLSAARNYNPTQILNVDYLIDLIRSVNLAASPVEFRTQNGQLFAYEPHFDTYGWSKRSSRTDHRANDSEMQFSSLIVDAVKFSSNVGIGGYPEKIYAIGDSHVRFLSGHDDSKEWPAGKFAIRFEGYSARFVGLHLGPGLAYSLNSDGTRNASKEKIEALLRLGEVPKGAEIIFSFGEIDCRHHVCRQAESQGRSIYDVVDEITQQYGIFLERIASAGYRCAVWGVPAATWQTETKDTDNPVYGSFEKRQLATRRFNQRMAAICRSRNLPFLSLFDQVHDAQGQPIREWFLDILHLSQKARPMLYRLMPDGQMPKAV